MAEVLRARCEPWYLAICFLQNIFVRGERPNFKAGMHGVFPICKCKRDPTQLADEIIALGFKAYLSCVEGKVGPGFVGRPHDLECCAIYHGTNTLVANTANSIPSCVTAPFSAAVLVLRSVKSPSGTYDYCDLLLAGLAVLEPGTPEIDSARVKMKLFRGIAMNKRLMVLTGHGGGAAVHGRCRILPT